MKIAFSRYLAPASAAVVAAGIHDSQTSAGAKEETDRPPVFLQSAVSVFRHGQRVPIHRHHAVDCKVGFEDPVDPSAIGGGKIELLHNTTASPLPLPLSSPADAKRAPPTFGTKNVPAGTLTTKGLHSMKRVGHDLRKRYLDPSDVSSCLIPPTMTAQEAAQRGLIYLRTTHTPRTLQSLQGVVSGLYPGEAASNDADAAAPLPVFSISSQHEYLFPNASHCPELVSLAVAGVTRFFEQANDEKHPNNFLALQSRLSAALGSPVLEQDVETIAGASSDEGEGKKRHHHHHHHKHHRASSIAGVKASTTPIAHSSASGSSQQQPQQPGDSATPTFGKPPHRWDFVRIRDLLVSLQADGQSLPAGLTDADMAELEKASTQQLCAFVDSNGTSSSSQRGMKMAAGRLLQELQLRVEQAALAHALWWSDLTTAAEAAAGREGKDKEGLPKITVALPEWATADHFLQLQLALLAQPYFPQQTAGLEAAPMPADAASAPGFSSSSSSSSSLSSSVVPRLSLLSGHDTSLLPILGALGLHDGEHWPPFASHIEVELFSSLPAPPTVAAAAAGTHGEGNSMMTTADAIRYLAAHTSSTPFAAASSPSASEPKKKETAVERLTHKASDALHHAADNIKKAASEAAHPSAGMLGAVVDSDGMPAFPERIGEASPSSSSSSAAAAHDDKEARMTREAANMAQVLVTQQQKQQKKEEEQEVSSPSEASLSPSQTQTLESLLDRFLDAVTSKDDAARGEALNAMNRLLDEAANSAASTAVDAVASALGVAPTPAQEGAAASNAAGGENTNGSGSVTEKVLETAAAALAKAESLLASHVNKMKAQAEEYETHKRQAEEQATKKAAEDVTRAVTEAVAQTQSAAAEASSFALAKALAFGERALKALGEQSAAALQNALHDAQQKAEAALATERAKTAAAEAAAAQREAVAASLAQTLSAERKRAAFETARQHAEQAKAEAEFHERHASLSAQLSKAEQAARQASLAAKADVQRLTEDAALLLARALATSDATESKAALAAKQAQQMALDNAKEAATHKEAAAKSAAHASVLQSRIDSGDKTTASALSRAQHDLDAVRARLAALEETVSGNARILEARVMAAADEADKQVATARDLVARAASIAASFANQSLSLSDATKTAGDLAAAAMNAAQQASASASVAVKTSAAAHGNAAAAASEVAETRRLADDAIRNAAIARKQAAEASAAALKASSEAATASASAASATAAAKSAGSSAAVGQSQKVEAVDSAALAEIHKTLEAAVAASEAAAQSAAAAHAAAVTGASEALLATQKADLQAEVAAARAQALGAVAESAEQIRRAQQAAAEWQAHAEAAKAKAAAEASSAVATSTSMQRKLEKELERLESVANAASKKSQAVVEQASKAMVEAIDKLRVAEDVAKETVAKTVARITAQLDRAVVRSAEIQRDAETEAMVAEAVAEDKIARARAASEIEAIHAADRISAARKRADAEIAALVAEAEEKKAKAAEDAKAFIEDARVARSLASNFTEEARQQVVFAKNDAEKAASEYETLCKTIDEQLHTAVSKAQKAKEEADAAIKKEEERVAEAQRRAAQAEDAANKTAKEAQSKVEEAATEASEIVNELKRRVQEEANKAEALVAKAAAMAAKSSAEAQSRVAAAVSDAAASAQKAAEATPAEQASSSLLEDAYRSALAAAAKQAKQVEKAAAEAAAEAQRRAALAAAEAEGAAEEREADSDSDSDSDEDSDDETSPASMRSAKAEASYLDALAAVLGFGAADRAKKLEEQAKAERAAREEKKLLQRRPMRVLQRRRQAVIEAIVDSAEESRHLLEALEAKVGPYHAFSHFLGEDHPLVKAFAEAAQAVQDKHSNAGKAGVKYPLDPGTGLPSTNPDLAAEPADKAKAEAIKQDILLSATSEEAQSSYLEALRASLHKKSLSSESLNAIVPLPAVDDEQLAKDAAAAAAKEKEKAEVEEEEEADAHFSHHYAHDPRFYAMRRRQQEQAAASSSESSSSSAGGGGGDKLVDAANAVSAYASVLSSIYGIVASSSPSSAAHVAAPVEAAAAAAAAPVADSASSSSSAASAESAYLAALRQQRAAAKPASASAPSSAPAVTEPAPAPVSTEPAAAIDTAGSGSGTNAYVASLASLFGLSKRKEGGSTPVAHASGRSKVETENEEAKVLVPEFFVRVVYNGQPLTLPGQSSPYTPLEAFRTLVAAAVPEDYASECGLPDLGGGSDDSGKAASGIPAEVPRMPVLPVLPGAASSLRAILGKDASRRVQEAVTDRALLEKLSVEIEKRVSGAPQSISAAEVDAAEHDALSSRASPATSFKLGGEAMVSDDEDRGKGSAVVPPQLLK